MATIQYFEDKQFKCLELVDTNDIDVLFAKVAELWSAGHVIVVVKSLHMDFICDKTANNGPRIRGIVKTDLKQE